MKKSDYMVIFDLDDTLYKEIEFLYSAYQEIADKLETDFSLKGIYPYMLGLYKHKANVFEELISRFNLPLKKTDLLNIYRNHVPRISLQPETRQTLETLSKYYPLGLLTDGRSVTQRNKIRALGLMPYFQSERNIIISEEFGSEKPDERNYLYFQQLYPEKQFVYVGDNVEKDFIVPNKLGWKTFCLLDNGLNIHPQSFDKPIPYLPQYKIHSLGEILSLL